MLKETIKYTTFDDVEIEEDFYFNLSKAELVRMEMNEYGGMQALLDKIVKEQDTKRIYNMFETIIQSAYGVRSDDGKSFLKRPEDLEKFVQSEAYSELIMRMLNDADYAAKFIRGTFPKDIQNEMDNQEPSLPKKVNNPIPAPPVK